MFRANEYVRGLSGEGGKAKNANEALSGFTVCGSPFSCMHAQHFCVD